MLAGQSPALPLWTARTKAEADAMLPQLRALHATDTGFQKRIRRGDHFRGYSITAERMVDFEVRWPESGDPNWRETVRCPETGLISRLRAAYHAYRTIRPEHSEDRIYLTEAATAFFRFMTSRYSGTIGSEYLADVPFGTKSPAGVRSEDLTSLRFDDASFDIVMSFEVLEHVPDYRAALCECARVLKPGGIALLTAPFLNNAETIVRASVGDDGEIIHHLPPDYHGDPINADGILCFYWFGWSLIDDLRSSGFHDACVAYYSSRAFGYLAPMQNMIIATR